MTAFPDLKSSVPAKQPLVQSIRFKTVITQFENGEENRKEKQIFAGFDIPIAYEYVDKADAVTLWQFFLDCKGRLNPFNLFVPWSNTYEGIFVGVGDGSTTIFNMPSKSATSETLYVDGVTKTGGGTDYTFTSQGGADNADKVEFVAAPADGEIITWDFTGYLKIRGRFDEDVMSYETFYDKIVSSGLKVRGLLNA